MATEAGESLYDRAGDIKQFDMSKTGVKGLVDSGVTSLPRIFVHPPDMIADQKRCHTSPELSATIPTIDLSGSGIENRAEVVGQIARASRELGFFQIVNHGVPVQVLDRLVGSIKAFHEQPSEGKTRYYRRDVGPTGVSFFSNLHLLHSKGASWRDSLQVRLGPNPPELEEVPEICRKEIMEWNQHCMQLGEVLMGILCEGLILNTSKLFDMKFLEGRLMVGHYYPWCPQPDLTVGVNSHTDPGLLTILLQDHIGGLQFKHDDNWLDVKPVPGALVINIGDVLQVMSNDQYKSVEHRVLANPFSEPRISIATFFNTSDRENLYGPFPELISSEKPALYRQLNFTEYFTRFVNKDFDGKSLINSYKL